MFDSLLKKLFGDKNVKATKDLWPIVDQINKETEKLQSLTDDELRAKTAEFKQRIAEATQDIITPLEELKTKLASVQSAEEKHALHDEIEGYEDQLT
ncbi:MAG: hypothetical protein Q8L04_13975, partial [Ignavibacteria bacterium]|nr:hypothetical protein [Ignavibacteria bacterium]